MWISSWATMFHKKYKSQRFTTLMLSLLLVNICNRTEWRYLKAGHPREDAFEVPQMYTTWPRSACSRPDQHSGRIVGQHGVGSMTWYECILRQRAPSPWRTLYMTSSTPCQTSGSWWSRGGWGWWSSYPAQMNLSPLVSAPRKLALKCQGTTCSPV